MKAQIISNHSNSEALLYASLAGFCGACAGISGKLLSRSEFTVFQKILVLLALVVFNIMMWTFNIDSCRLQSVVTSNAQNLIANSITLGIMSYLIFNEFAIFDPSWFLGIIFLVIGTVLLKV